jgi:hypothetical protein
MKMLQNSYLRYKCKKLSFIAGTGLIKYKNNELRISILFSVIVVSNLFSSLKYTILL